MDVDDDSRPMVNNAWNVLMTPQVESVENDRKKGYYNIHIYVDDYGARHINHDRKLGEVYREDKLVNAAMALIHFSLKQWNYEYFVDNLDLFARTLSKDVGNGEENLEIVGQCWDIRPINDVSVNQLKYMSNHICGEFCEALGYTQVKDQKELAKKLKQVIKLKESGGQSSKIQSIGTTVKKEQEVVDKPASTGNGKKVAQDIHSLMKVKNRNSRKMVPQVQLFSTNTKQWFRLQTKKTEKKPKITCGSHKF